jgi:8-oxo-dGTP pyrophosphatase MutT (NUDIX family)
MYEGAGVLFYKNEGGKTSISLGKRAINPHKNFWSVPGGKMCKSKDKNIFLNCALRETKEEYFSEDINDTEFTKISSRSYSKVNKIILPFLFEFRTFLIDITDINIKFTPNWEFSRIEWFDVNKLPEKTHIGVKYSLYGWRPLKA